MTAREIYEGSNGEATQMFYRRLEDCGPIGVVAMNIFRAQKASERAKVYSRRFKGMAYDKKNWSLEMLVEALLKHGESLKIGFGWKQDPNPPPGFPWVLYVDLPTGQASFHSRTRGKGPDYSGEWDASGTSAARIVAFAQSVIAREGELKKEGAI